MNELYLQALETKMNESAGDAERASIRIRGATGSPVIEDSLYVIALELRAQRHRHTFERAYDRAKLGRP